MNVFPLVEHIQANTDLVIGQDLFRFSLPAQVSTGVVVMSEGPGAAPDHEIRGRHRARFQVISRSSDYETATARADELYNLLFIDARTQIGTMTVESSLPKHLPLPYKRGDGDLVEVSINFDILFFLA